MYCYIYISDYICQLYTCKISTKETRCLRINLDLLDSNENANENKQSDKCCITFCLNPWQLQMCLVDLTVCPHYRRMVVGRLRVHNKRVILKINPPTHELIDYAWNWKTRHTTWQKVEMDNIMSWLSTLGGAFSALGDNFNNCAEIAGKISVYQLNLAMAFGDPLLVCRCKLYYSLSMMQKGYLRQAKRLILQQYEFAQTVEEYDDRLVKMCHGIWMKLQYAYTLRKRKRLAIS